MAELTRGLKLAADGPYPGAIDLSGEMARLRANLLPEEGERYRAVSQLCAEAMDAAIRAVRPGISEYEIAALLDRETFARGVQPIVNLIATDERIFNFRHPLPTRQEDWTSTRCWYCADAQHGLVTSITRLVHFGRLPDDLRRKMEAVARIDAAFIAATRPGRTLSEVFKRATDVYAQWASPTNGSCIIRAGRPAYEPREWVGTPASTEVVDGRAGLCVESIDHGREVGRYHPGRVERQ